MRRRIAHDERLNRDADICGLDRTYIGGIERGERNVSLVDIERIANALKISIPRLFKKSLNSSSSTNTLNAFDDVTSARQSGPSATRGLANFRLVGFGQ